MKSKNNSDLPAEKGSDLFSRRGLLKLGAGALMAGALPVKGFNVLDAAPKKSSSKNIEKGSRPVVVIARNDKAWKGGSLDEDVVQRLLFDAVRKVAGAEGDAEAWKTFFGPRDYVGLKLNCLGGKYLSPRPQLVKAICGGISMAGVPDSAMLLWDQTDRDLKKGGYRIVTSGGGVLCHGTDNQDRRREAEFDGELTEKGAVGCRVTGIASRTCGALVNVCVLKDHDLAGVSISLKNYYGAIHNPNKYHANGCSPYVADVYSFDTLGGKTRLVVCDATTAQCEGGPGYKEAWAWKYGGILVSTDPVALDAVGHSIIARRRAELGLPSLEKVKRPPAHIKAAAARGLGEADLKKINIVNIS